MTRVSISRRTAEALLGIRTVDDLWDPGERRAMEELRAALRPKRRKALSFPSRAKARRAKKETRKEETARIRAEVFARAEGICELCEAAGADDLHHVFGRVRVRQSVRNTLAICRGCHRALTANRPSAAHWLEKQIAHLGAHGYGEEAGQATRLLGKHQAKAQLAAGVGT